MMFMSDTERSAELALEFGLDVGLHLNFTEQFSGKNTSTLLNNYHKNISNFLLKSKYSFIIYSFHLRRHFNYIYERQYDEYLRLYKKIPNHIDGHHHMHLCANVIFDRMIPKGIRVRKNFSFFPREKNLLNMCYRKIIDFWLRRRYICTDYFFSLSPINQPGRLQIIIQYSKKSCVEIMVHPGNTKEFSYLMSEEYRRLIDSAEK